MYSSARNRGCGHASYWRGWVCLLLALLMLYNPFAASLSSANALNFRHPPSNRATVGASELQHYSFANGRDSLTAHDNAAQESSVLPAGITSQSFELFPRASSLLQQIFGASLWFRPPPAL